jgi:hypothetical protein
VDFILDAMTKAALMMLFLSLSMLRSYFTQRAGWIWVQRVRKSVIVNHWVVLYPCWALHTTALLRYQVH